MKRIAIVALLLLGGLATWRIFVTPMRVDGPSVARDSNSSPPVADVESAVVQPRRPRVDYIGSQACGHCHEEIADKYRRTPMGRSLARVAEASAPHEDYENRTSFNKSPWAYQVERKGDRVWHHETLSDDEGLIYDQSEEIQFAVGSNTRGRSYLLWREGLMFSSPIAWYAKEGWDLSPGFKAGQHLRFSRRAGDACVTCHCGRAVTDQDRANVFPEPVFHELAIGCERCHGPGGDHVQYHQSPSKTEADPLLDLSRLASTQRDGVCYQCHFQGEDRILRSGRAEEDFRPGMNVSDVWAIFVRAQSAADSTAAVSQASQMQSSRCYQASNGRLGCVSCHDPHESSPANLNREIYDGRCGNCHSDRGCSLAIDKRHEAPANGSCTLCHMPALHTNNVPHTCQTDHRILRRQRSVPTTETELTVYQDDGSSIPEAELDRARGLMLVRAGLASRNRRLAEDGVKLLQTAQRIMPDDEEIQYQLGTAFAFLGNIQRAQAFWLQLVQQHPQHEQALQQLANAAQDSGRYAEADQLFSRLVKLDPRQPVTHGRWAHTLGTLNRLDEAIEQARRAVALDPSMLPIYGWLAEAYAIQADQTQSEYFRRLGQRLSKATSTKPRE